MNGVDDNTKKSMKKT